jgi:hypothetical protein
MQLRAAAQSVNHSRATVGFNVVKNDAHAYTSGFESFEKAGKSQRETTRRPTQRRVLH